MSNEFDSAVLKCFLKKQLQLFPEKVAEDEDEAEEFLLDCMAVVVESVDEVWEYLKKKVLIWKAQIRMKSLRHQKFLMLGMEDIS